MNFGATRTEVSSKGGLVCGLQDLPRVWSTLFGLTSRSETEKALGTSGPVEPTHKVSRYSSEINGTCAQATSVRSCFKHNVAYSALSRT